MSHDIEDVIAVIDGRSETVEEVLATDADLYLHLKERFQALLRDEKFTSVVSCHLPSDEASQARATYVLARIKAMFSKHPPNVSDG